MSLDIFGALRRMVTLPKSKNSLADILGNDAAHAITQTIHDLLASSLVSALTGALTAGDRELGQLQGVLTSAVTGALKDVSPALATQLNGAVEKAISDAEALALANVPKIAGSIVAEVGKVLKITV